jgi:uncharacterized Zn finger protein
MRARIECPFCGSDDTEVVAAWGGQLITSLIRCRACNTHFEAVRETFDPGDPFEISPE